MNKRIQKLSMGGMALVVLCLCLVIVVIGAISPRAALAVSAIPVIFGMAVTTQNSTQEANRVAAPPVLNTSYDWKGKTRAFYFAHTQSGAGDANSLVNLVTLPPGKVRLLKTESVFVCSALGAARTLDIGYLAHTKIDGTAVNASVDAVLDGADVSAAASVRCGAGTNALGTDPTILLDSKEGVTLQAKCLGDTIPDGATLKGYFLCAIE